MESLNRTPIEIIYNYALNMYIVTTYWDKLQHTHTHIIYISYIILLFPFRLKMFLLLLLFHSIFLLCCHKSTIKDVIKYMYIWWKDIHLMYGFFLFLFIWILCTEQQEDYENIGNCFSEFFFVLSAFISILSLSLTRIFCYLQYNMWQMNVFFVHKKKAQHKSRKNET